MQLVYLCLRTMSQLHILVLGADCDLALRFQVSLWRLTMGAFRSFTASPCTLWGCFMAPQLPQLVRDLGMNLPSKDKEPEVLLFTSRPCSSLGPHWLWLELTTTARCHFHFRFSVQITLQHVIEAQPAASSRVVFSFTCCECRHLWVRCWK